MDGIDTQIFQESVAKRNLNRPSLARTHTRKGFQQPDVITCEHSRYRYFLSACWGFVVITETLQREHSWDLPSRARGPRLQVSRVDDPVQLGGARRGGGGGHRALLCSQGSQYLGSSRIVCRQFKVCLPTQ